MTIEIQRGTAGDRNGTACGDRVIYSSLKRASGNGGGTDVIVTGVAEQERTCAALGEGAGENTAAGKLIGPEGISNVRLSW